jgi:hypothetical protein
MKNSMPILRSSWLLALGVALGPLAMQGALVIEGRANAENNRFANDPAFIAGAALSGLGRSIDNTPGRWGSLVSQNVFISAYHYRPVVGHSLTFHATNDPAGPSETRTIIDARRMGSSDIWVGVLDASLPPDYQPFAFYGTAITSAAEFAASPLAESQALMVGRWEDTPSLVTNVAVGQNIVEQWFASGTFTGIDQPTLIAVQDLPGDTDWFVPFEAYVATFDSGAPLLVELNGVLTIVGLNWLKIENLPLSWRKGRPETGNASGFSIVGNEASGIQSAIAAFAVDATAGYIAWMAFALGTTDWMQAGPAIDFDGDGLDNFTEYAFVLDATNPQGPNPVISSAVNVSGSFFLEAAFSVREDPDLQYTVRTGSDLDGWSGTSLSFASGWSSANPSTVSIVSATDNGDGTWKLVVRDAAGLVPGSSRFISVRSE